MAKKLVLSFETEDEKAVALTLASPMEGLDAEAVKAAGAKLVPVLMNTAGAHVKALTGAKYVTTTDDVIL